ncbi:hypothetical protein [Flavobacterium sp.]|jgi:hypothetical protein|uniref:hypothetical protein n=1 Tax=Flavobacterium sp. TaxID=239 RepID=UPI0040472BEB
MKKSILNLVGTQELTKVDQKNIMGGKVLLASFPCYCNNVFKKNCDTVACCTSACGL